MKVSTTGYKRNSKDKKHKQLYIPGDILTMLGVDDYVQATPQYPDGSLGKTTTMAPGVPRISFPGAVGVIEKKLPKAQYGNQKDVERSWANSGHNSDIDIISRGTDTAPFLFGVNTDVIDLSNPSRWVWKNAPTPEPVTLDLNDPNYNRYKQWETVYNLDQQYMPWLVNRLNDPSIPLNEKSHGPNWLPGSNYNDEESLQLSEIYDSRFLEEPYIKNNYDLSLLNDHYSYGDLMTENQYDFANEGLPIWAVTVDKDSTPRNRKFSYLHQFFETPPPAIYLKGKDLKPTTLPATDIQPQLQNMAPLADGSKVQRVTINTPQGDMVRVQDPKTKKFIRWENVSGEAVDFDDESVGDTSSDFPQIQKSKSRPSFEYGGSLPKAQTGTEAAGQASNRLARRQQWLSRNPRNAYYTDIDEFTRANQAEEDSLNAALSTRWIDMMLDNDRRRPSSFHDPRSGINPNSPVNRFNPAPGRGSIANETIRPQRVRYETVVDSSNIPHTIRVNDYKWPETHAVYKEEIKPKMIEAKPFIIPQVDIQPQLGNIPELPIPKGSKKQRVIVNTPQGDMVRVQDPKTKKFIRWEDTSGESIDFEKKPTGNATDDFPEQKKQGGELDKYQLKGQVPDYITPYANKAPVEKPTGAFPSAIQNPDKPDKWYRLSEELTTGDSYDYSNVRRLGEKGKEGYDDYGGALKYDAEARKLYSSFPISNTAYQTSEMSIVSEPSRMGKYYKEFMEAHPNPDDWEDGRDPNSPILEDMLGGLLGIGKTATNPYTGKGWDYYNRRTNHENARTDYIAMKILGENPQGDRNRQDWLASFTPGELALLQKSHKYSGEVAANRWAEGAQGLVNYALTGPGGIMPNPLKEYIPNLFPGQLSDEEAEDTGILNGIGMLAIPAEGIKGWVTEGSNRGWKGASPIDYTGGRDKVLDVAGEVFIDPLNLVGVGVLKGLGKIHAGILDDIILKSVQEAGKLNINPTEVFIRNAQREGLIPASANVKTLVDNPNLLNTVVTRGIKNNLTVARRVTPSAGAGVAESSKGTITDLAKGDAAALARFTGDPVGEAFHMGTHIPRTAYGQRSGLSSLGNDVDALYFDAPGNFARQERVLPNQYGDYTVTSRIPFEYSSDPQSMYAKYMRMLRETKGMSGGKGAKPGDIFGRLHGAGAEESAIIGRPGQQVLEPVSVSTINDYNKPIAEFEELMALSKEDPEKFKAAFWEKYNSGQIARTKQEAGLSDNQMFIEPLYGDVKNNPTINDLKFALRADAQNKQFALKGAAPIQKTNFSPLTTNFGNSAPVQLTGSQANRRLATAQKQFDVLNKRGYENLTPDELLDAFRLEHEIKNLSTQVNKNTGTTAEAFSDAAETTATVGKEPVDLSKLPNRFNTNGSNADNLDFRRVRLTDKDEPVIIPYIKGTDIPFHRAYRQDMVSYFNSPQFHSIMDTHYPGVDKELYKENILKNLESPLVYNPNFVSETAAGNYHRHTSRSDLGRNVFSLGAPKLQTKVKYANTYHSAPELERFGEKAGNSYVNSEYAVKHEYRHQATNSEELLPESLTKEDLLNNLTPEGKVLMEKEIAENKKYRVDNYYSNPTEFDVRIRRLKDDLKENGIVDYFNEPVTQEHIAQLLEQQKAYDEYEKIGTEKLWQEFTAGRREIKNNPNLTEAQKKEATDLLKEKYEKDQDLMDASKPAAPKINKDTKDLLRYWSTEFLANKAGILPAAIPVGIGIGVATQEKKKGGSVNKRNHKDLDNYFAQAWSKSRKTA